MRPLISPRPVWLLALALCACGDTPLLELSIVRPRGADPLQQVDQLRLVLTNPPRETVTAVSGGELPTLELTLGVEGEVGQVVLEGSRQGALVARGETPGLQLWAKDGEARLLVARAEALSELVPRWADAVLNPAVTRLRGLGSFWAGGELTDGSPTDRAVLYDFLLHELLQLPAMPEPRGGAAAVPCGARCALLVGGYNGTGLAETMLRFDGERWTSHADGLAAAQRRSGAVAARLDDGSSLLVGGASGASGAGSAGPLRSALRVVADASGEPTMTVVAAPAAAARMGPAVAVGGRVVLMAGGQQPGEPACELFFADSSTFHTVALDGPALAGESAAVALSDGRLAVVGGRAEDGTLLRDGWVVDPAALTAQHLPDVLEQGRAGHRVVRVGQRLLVLGGMGEALEQPAPELLSATSLAWIRRLPAGLRRLDPQVVPLSAGSLLVLGGSDGGEPVGALEVYQSGQRIVLP